MGTFYVFDGPDRVLDIEVRGTNAPVLSRRYIHGASVDQPVALETFVPGSAAPEGEFSYHADHLGSVRILTDEAGEVVNEYDYDAYGQPEIIQESVAQPFLYTGREWEAESAVYQYRARAYDPTTGRFLQEDPIWFAAGDLNVHRYVWNNPLNWTDPSGLNGIGAAGTRASSQRGAVTAGLIGLGLIALYDCISDAIDVFGLDGLCSASGAPPGGPGIGFPNGPGVGPAASPSVGPGVGPIPIPVPIPFNDTEGGSGSPEFGRCIRAANSPFGQDFENFCRSLPSEMSRAKNECFNTSVGGNRQRKLNFCHRFFGP